MADEKEDFETSMMRGYGRSTPDKTRDGKTRNYKRAGSKRKKRSRGKRR